MSGTFSQSDHLHDRGTDAVARDLAALDAVDAVDRAMALPPPPSREANHIPTEVTYAVYDRTEGGEPISHNPAEWTRIIKGLESRERA